MIVLYTAPRSSGDRCHWMLNEIGRPFELVITDLKDPEVRRKFSAINPACKIPYLVDGDFALSESTAVNLYLAERYDPRLMPADVLGRARVYQWTSFSITNLLPELLKVVAQAFARPSQPRDEVSLGAARAEVARHLAVIERGLEADYLVGGAFGVADVNAGSVVNSVARAKAAELGPRTAAWLARLRARPAFQSAYAV